MALYPTVVIAVAVAMAAMSYWNASTWRGLGGDFFFYKGQSDISEQQYAELILANPDADISAMSIQHGAVTIRSDLCLCLDHVRSGPTREQPYATTA